MGEPTAIGEVVLDHDLAARLAVLAPDPIPPVIGPETTEEAEARRQQARDSLNRFWERRVPGRYAAALIDTLTPQQNPQGRVATWWENGGQTLVLRSEKPGVGKSHAAVAVGRHAVANGAWSAFWTAIDLNDALRPGNDPAAYDVARECDLLVLDDLGRERITEWTIERLTSVLDARWSNDKRTVITTNLPGDKFVERYGDPIVDRIRDGLWTVAITGESRRTEAPW